MKTVLQSIVLLIFSISTSSAQITFQKTYGSSNLEEGTSVLALADGYLITGSTSSFGSGGKDIFTMKTDLSGVELWSHVYGGSLDDEAFSLQPTFDGGFIIAGVTYSYVGPSLQDYSNIYLIKIDNSGNYLWSKTINSGGLDAAYSIKETDDHGFIITGYTGSFVSGPDNLLVVKTDSAGTTQWTKILGSASNSVDIGRSVIQKRDGGYAVAGFSTAFSTPGDTSTFLAILNPAGNLLFTRHIAITNLGTQFPSPQTSAYDIIQNTDGNLVVAGAVGGINGGVVFIAHSFLMLTDSIGNYISAKFYGFGTGHDRVQSVHQTPDGGYLCGGFMGNYYPMMFKTNNLLTKQWCFLYGNYNAPGNISHGQGFSAALTPDSGFVITGYNLVNQGKRIHLIKTDSIGQSGCNQALPNFSGLGQPAVVTNIAGTVFSFGSSNYNDVTSTYSNITFADSNLCISTGVNEFDYVNFTATVYPNPVNEEITIKYSIHESEKINCAIYTSSGKLVFVFEFPGNKNSFNLNTSNLPSGIYQLKMYGASGNSNIKFAVIH